MWLRAEPRRATEAPHTPDMERVARDWEREDEGKQEDEELEDGRKAEEGEE